MGFLRRFVGLAHMIFYPSFYLSIFSFFASLLVFPIYLRVFSLGCCFGAGSLWDRLQSAFVPVKLRDPHFLDRPINVRRGWVCSSSAPDVFYVDDGDSSNFFVFVPQRIPRVNLGFPSSMSCMHASPCPPRHAMLRLCVVHHTRIHSRSRRTTSLPSWSSAFGPLALVDALRGPPNTVASQGAGLEGPSPIV